MRALIYRLRFSNFGFPSLFGKPIYILGSSNISIGKYVRIFPGARMETHGSGTIKIADDVSIGQNLHIISGGQLIIGKKTTISGNVFITNIDHDYRQIGKHIMEQQVIVSDTYIGENCFIGYGACIQAGTRLGIQCIVGANAVVKGEFPDYSIIAGVPAKLIKRFDFNSNSWVRVP